MISYLIFPSSFKKALFISETGLWPLLCRRIEAEYDRMRRQ